MSTGLIKQDGLQVIQEQPTIQNGFSDSASFEHAQRVAKMLSASNLIPTAYQNNIQNTMIALEMANRIGATPLMVMQNLHVIQGKPSWSSAFIIAAINSCKKFSPLRFVVRGKGNDMECTARAKDLATGKNLTGVKVTMKMAIDEGWVARAGSKWRTMPELMIQYRAAAFFGRLYVPEIMMGMLTAEEVQDISDKTGGINGKATIEIEDLRELFKLKKDTLSPEEIKNVNRILSNKEEKSYAKLHKTLQAK